MIGQHSLDTQELEHLHNIVLSSQQVAPPLIFSHVQPTNKLLVPTRRYCRRTLLQCPPRQCAKTSILKSLPTPPVPTTHVRFRLPIRKIPVPRPRFVPLPSTPSRHLYKQSNRRNLPLPIHHRIPSTTNIPLASPSRRRRNTLQSPLLPLHLLHHPPIPLIRRK